MTKKETAPAVKEEKSTALVAGDYGDFSGQGFENLTQDDISIPFLNVLQSTSPEQKKDGIPGAEAGMFFNSVTQELFETVVFVPSIRVHEFVEWIKRDEGGGLVASHAPNSAVVKAAKADAQQRGLKFGKYEVNKHDLVETFYVYGVIVVDGSPQGMAVMALTSTKITAYKKMMTRLNTFQLSLEDGRRINPPLFAHPLVLGTKLEKRPAGDSYNITFTGLVEDNLAKGLLATDNPAFLMAAECKALIESGAAKADHASNTAAPSDEDGDGGMPF